MSWRMPLYKLSITTWYILPTMKLHACCMTPGRIHMSVTFSAVYNERHASGRRCFWMRWIEPAVCRLTNLLPEYSWEAPADALTTQCFRTLVSATASRGVYTASLTACTSSFVLATHCIKNTKHVSVQEDGGCVGLRCGHLVIICNMMPRSQNWGSAYCQASSSLPSFANRTCKRPAADVASDTQPSIVVPSASAVRRQPVGACPGRGLVRAGHSGAPLRGCRRDGMCLALCWLSRNDMGWALECVFASSKTPLCRPPPHRCQPRPLLMRRSLGLVPKPRAGSRRQSWQAQQAAAVNSTCCLWRRVMCLLGRC